MDEELPKSSRSWRPRFSLLTSLLLMTIVGMAIVLVQLWREVGPLRAAVIRLRNEVGVLSVGDQKKLHAIQIDTKDELTWRWRVWIPQGVVYVVRCTGEEIPEEGFPQRDCSSIWLREPGEQVIEYRIRRDPRDEKWYGSLHAGSGSVGKSFQPWVDWPNLTSTGEGVGRLTKVSEPGKPLVLSRHRVSQATNSDQIEDPSAGFMIWMEPSR